MVVCLEGGNHLRSSMRGFLRKAAGNDINLDVTACRDRDRAIARFGKESAADSLLLIDAEGDDLNVLRQRVISRTSFPDATARTLFMVQLMEAGFLADPSMLEVYYGRGFSLRSLPANPNIENIPKPDVERGLRDASRRCSKGAYDKTTHTPDLLIQLNPTTVYNACLNFALLINHLREQAAA